MTYAEGVHLLAGTVSIAPATMYVSRGQELVALSLAIVTIPLHVYPVLLQRWNRGGVLRLRRRPAAPPPTSRPEVAETSPTTNHNMVRLDNLDLPQHMTTTILLIGIQFSLIAVFCCVQKGFNQVISGLNAIHEQLQKLDDRKERSTL
jgi:hypothetical protein